VGAEIAEHTIDELEIRPARRASGMAGQHLTAKLSTLTTSAPSVPKRHHVGDHEQDPDGGEHSGSVLVPVSIHAPTVLTYCRDGEQHHFKVALPNEVPQIRSP
jgi:hypothetical protein